MVNKQYSTTQPVCTVTFSLTAEQAGPNAKVCVLGTFNDWNVEQALTLNNTNGGYEGSIDLNAGSTYEFRYFLNNQEWLNDEQADDFTPNNYNSYNGVIVIDDVVIAASAKKAKPKATAKKVVTANAKKATPIKKTTAKKAAGKKIKATDLKKIEGIGPKIAGLLTADGIATFADLATADIKKLKAILEAAGSRYRMHDPATWSEQAQLAADNKWEELAKLQDELKGGKR